MGRGATRLNFNLWNLVLYLSSVWNWVGFLDTFSNVQELLGVLFVGSTPSSTHTYLLTHLEVCPGTLKDACSNSYHFSVLLLLLQQWKGQAWWLLTPFLLLHNQVCWWWFVLLHVSVASSICASTALPSTPNHLYLQLSQTIVLWLLKQNWKHLELTSPHCYHIHPACSQWLVAATRRQNSTSFATRKSSVWGVFYPRDQVQAWTSLEIITLLSFSCLHILSFLSPFLFLPQ